MKTETAAREEFKIEHNIPIPKPRVKRGHWAKTLGRMKIGDSILVYGHSTPGIASALRVYQRKIGYRFVQRRLSKDNVRIWRVE